MFIPNYFPTLDHLFVTQESKQDFMENCIKRYERECKIYGFVSQSSRLHTNMIKCADELNRLLTEEEKRRIWEEALEKNPDNYKNAAKKIGSEGINSSKNQGAAQLDCSDFERGDNVNEAHLRLGAFFSPGNSSQKGGWSNFFQNRSLEPKKESRTIKYICAGTVVLLASCLLFRRLTLGNKMALLKGDEIAVSRSVIQEPEITKLAAVFLFSIGLSSSFAFIDPISVFVS